MPSRQPIAFPFTTTLDREGSFTGFASGARREWCYARRGASTLGGKGPWLKVAAWRVVFAILIRVVRRRE